MHLRNRTSTVVVVSGDLPGIAPGDKRPADPSAGNTIVPPCGPMVTIVPGRHPEPDGRSIVLLMVDPSGRLDVEYDASGGDTAVLSGGYELTIVWSRGDLTTPVWLTITPSDVELSQAELTDAPPTTCPPRVRHR